MPSFSDIRGQDRAHHLLRRAAARGRLPHAFLFHGTRGVGKTDSAFALAQFLNCPDRGELESCGSCPSCRKTAKLQHPDVRWIFPMPGSLKGEKRTAHIRKTMDERISPGIHGLTFPGAASIAIGRDEDTRAGSVGELRRQAGYAPVEAGIKVFVVSEAERMTAEAANSLLKVLEEPPPDNLLVLTAQRPSNLLDTIVSRCQLIRFPDLGEAEIVGMLIERGGTWSRKGEQQPPDPKAAALAAALSRGSLTYAARFVEEDVVELRNEALAFLSLPPGDPRVHDAVAELAGARDRSVIERLLDFGMLWLGDLLRVATGSEVSLANRDQETRLRNEGALISVDEIRRRVEVLREAREAMGGNVYLPLVLYQLTEGLAAGHASRT